MRHIVVLISWLFLWARLIRAADFEVSGEPLFSESLDGSWYPGRRVTKTVSLRNSSSEVQVMAVKGERVGVISLLEEVLWLSVADADGVVWEGKVVDFYALDKIELGAVQPATSADYDFTVTMIKTAGDEYQGKRTVFDLTLGFWEIEGQLGGAGLTTAVEGEVAGAEKGQFHFEWWWLIFVLGFYVMMKIWCRLRR